MSLNDRFRQPEYIGENRCTPCAILNVALAISVSVFVAVFSPLLGAGVFILSLSSIYFRGYLVPGTPTLTKRYLPQRVLRWFDKGTTMTTTDETIEIDPERILLDAGVVEPCQERPDLCLTPDFQQAWRKHIHTIRTHNRVDEEHLADTLHISRMGNQYTVNRDGEAYVASNKHGVVSQWSSQAAAIADVAAATELSERVSDWSDLAPTEIAHVLMSLRIFIEQCPECDGLVQVEQNVVESCCRSYDVIASSCQDCESRLFELEWDDIAATDTQEEADQSSQATA